MAPNGGLFACAASGRTPLAEVASAQFLEAQVAKAGWSKGDSRAGTGSTTEARRRKGHNLRLAPEFNVGQMRASLKTVAPTTELLSAPTIILGRIRAEIDDG